MTQATLIYSLSRGLKKLNKSLTQDILLLKIADINDTLINVKANAILFETKHIDTILETVDSSRLSENRFICVGENLNADERLLLLNKNIEFITTEKYIEIGFGFFEIQKTKKTHKILFVEDDEDQIMLIESMLATTVFEIKSITKGEDVLHVLDEFKPDLLLMDLYLEGITGDKLVRVIRKEPKNKKLPIVFLTSDTTIESRMMVLNAGADDLLTKPIDSKLLISALLNRMQRSYTSFPSVLSGQAKISGRNIKDTENEQLHSFLDNNKTNRFASLLWLKVTNKEVLQKKLGYSGFKSICGSLFQNMPLFRKNIDLKFKLADGIMVLAFTRLTNKQAIVWAEKLQKWVAKNYFSINKKNYYFEIVTIISSEFNTKKELHKVPSKAEELLLENKFEEDIITLNETSQDSEFDKIKGLLETAIKTRNFSWLYQNIVATKDVSQEIYQLMLQVNNEAGIPLAFGEYNDVAHKTGLLRLLDRFTLEHAIRIIRAGDSKKINTRTLLNQSFMGYQSLKSREQKLAIIKRLKLPHHSIIFQFTLEDAIEYSSELAQIGKDLAKAKINICLSNFDCSNMAWKIARKLQVNWIRISAINNTDNKKDVNNPETIGQTIKKAQALGYKVIVARVDSAHLAAEMWKLNIDFLQGSFIQEPSNKLN